MVISEFDHFVEFSRENKLFQSLKRPELEQLFKRLVVRNIPKGTIVVREQAYKESGFYVIANGWVKVVSFGKEGVEQIYSVLTRHDFFGEMSLLEDKPTSAAVIAKTDCLIYVLDRESFFSVLEKHPIFTVELLKLLSARIRSANRLVNNFAFMSAAQKLKLYILDLAHRRGKRVGNGTIVVPNVPTQMEIGSAIGHRRETIAREMKKLSDDKIISYSRKNVVIYNENALQD